MFKLGLALAHTLTIKVLINRGFQMVRVGRMGQVTSPLMALKVLTNLRLGRATGYERVLTKSNKE